MYNQPYTTLPVTRDGYLCGVASKIDVLPILAAHSREEWERAFQHPVEAIVRPPLIVAHPEMTTEEIGRLFAHYRLDCIPVVDAENYCLGIVCAGDLLAPNLPPPRPERIGGMATPFGVYLTDGLLQAGAGNGALVATGAFMATLFIAAYCLVDKGLWLLQSYAHLPASPIFNLDYEPPIQRPLLGLASVFLSVFTTLVFLILMRTTRLAGYHAAEHQTVHALERGEPLVPEIVRRMPRPHPRCGTNLMAAALVWWNLTQLLKYVPAMDAQIAPLLAAIATLFTWRSVGTFLQERLTTKPPSDRELTSGIQAGKDLIEKYGNSPPIRPRFLRRLLCTGLPQVILGWACVLALSWPLARYL
jgi:hypothetical protein